MKLTLLSQNLQKKISLVNHAISSRSPLPILSNFLLEAAAGKLRILATDLEIGLQVDVAANIEEEGSVAIPAKLFYELIQSFPEEKITISLEKETLLVKGKNIQSSFQTNPKDEFPKLYEEAGEKIATFTTSDLKNAISQVVFAASLDTTRAALSGILVKREENGFLLVATDGYRLSLKHHSVKESREEVTLLIPARVFKELLQFLEQDKIVELYVAKASNQVMFVQEETVLVGRLIEATFPNYEKIIPTDFSTKAIFDLGEMQKAVKISSLFARESANIVKFSLEKETIRISAATPSLGENIVTVEAKITGEENQIAFNAKYLLDLFSNITSDTIVFEMNGPVNPGVFKIENDPSFLHIIMPIRVQQEG